MRNTWTINHLKNKILEYLYQSQSLDESVQEILSLVGNYFDVDRVYIFENTADDLRSVNTFEWCNEGNKPEKENLQDLRYLEDMGGEWLDNYDENGLFFCSSVDALPEKQREVLKPQNITSMLQCAIMEAGKFRGFIGFDNCGENSKGWEQDQEAIDTLIYTSRLLSLFLLEYRNIQNRVEQEKQQIQLKEQRRQLEVQEQLRRSEEVTEAACNFSNMWVWTFNMENDSVYCYQKLRDDFGLPMILEDYPEAWLKMRFILPESEDVYRDNVKRVKDGEESAECECKIRFPDGSEHWIRIRLNRMKDHSKMAVCTSQLIDEEKYLKTKIELEERLQDSGDTKLLAHFVTNLSKNIPLRYVYEFKESPELKVWKSLEEQSMLVEERIYDVNQRKMFHNMHETKSLLKMYAEGKTEDSMEYRRILPDGKILWVRSEIHLLREPETGDILNYEYCYDIHDQKIMETTLLAAVDYNYECFASILLDNGQITVLLGNTEESDVKFLIENYVNRCHRYGEGNVIPSEREQFFKSVSLENLRVQLADKNVYDYMHRTEEEDGIHVKRTRYVLYDEKNQSVLMTRMDVTETVRQEEEKRRELQAALDAAKQASVAKTDFLARMSHDIRTPMNAIMGLTALTMDDVEHPEIVKENLWKISSSSEFLLGLINDILDMSKIESGSLQLNMEPYSYMDFLTNIKIMFEPLCQEKGINFEFEEVIVKTIVMTDKTRLNQIFFNIISNAVKYTPEGGTVSYYTKNIVADEHGISADYYVSDSGTGISEEFQKIMFEPFSQEDNRITPHLQGTGLGLSITKSIVELMGGSIRVESEKGKGTTVIVHLGFEFAPKEHREEVEDIIPAKIDHDSLNGKRVLLVEDHPLNAEIARKLLEKKNMVVYRGENGKIAVEKFATSEENFFDIILMDIRMPKMNGIEATKAIRELDREDARTIPIIAMTANAYDQDVEECREAGMNEHLAKPVNPSVLYETLESFLA